MMRPDLVNDAQLSQIDFVLNTYHASLRPEDRELEQVQVITRLARKGIGFHHAGLLPVLKQLVEVLFSRGLMQVVFATDTLALGVNMPARTVVIGRMSKWDGRRRRALIPNEFQQMAGRAGRRGMDVFGHVVVPYSPWVPFREALEIATGPLHPVQSAFAIRYNTVLNLWDPPRGERVRQMLQRSLAQYQTSQRIRLIENDILDIEGELVGLVKAGQEKHPGPRRIIRRVPQPRPATPDARNDKKDRPGTRRSCIAHERCTPWTEPGRQALRRAFDLPRLVPSCISAIMAGQSTLDTAPRAVLALCSSTADSRFHALPEYRMVDYLPDDVRCRCPRRWLNPVTSPSILSAHRRRTVG